MIKKKKKTPASQATVATGRRPGRPSKIRTTKAGKQFRPCPCPIHQGKELPLTEKYFHRAGEGFQGYCREYRNEVVAQANKANRKKKREGGQAECRTCKKKFPLDPEHWQKDSKRANGFRPDCKLCIANNKKKKKNVDKKLLTAN